MKKLNKKIFWWIAAVLAAVVIWLGLSFYPNYKVWDLNRRLTNFQQELENYLKGDVYGGKTPQETYESYVAALKNGDLEKASKYFYWERQGAQKTRLEEMKAKGELEKYIVDLPDWSKMREEEYWDESGKEFSYEYVLMQDRTYYDEMVEKEVTLKKGVYKSIIDFQFNAEANIWKIYSNL